MIIKSPTMAYNYFKNMESLEVEEVWCAALNSDKKVIASEMIYRGSVDMCLLLPRDVFRFALKHNAASLLIAHNHPSGGTMPSPEDIKITKRLIKSAKILQIPINDHIIVGKNGFYSFLEGGIA